MTTTNATLKELCANVRATSTGAPRKPREEQDEWQRNANGYRVTLHYQGRRYSFDFWQGVGIDGPPDAEGCLDCLLSDAMSGEESFEDFCANMGYDTDSRRAERIWRECGKIKTRLERLLGDDFETFCYADR